MNKGEGSNARLSGRLTSAEMDEKRRRGICFCCDDRYTFGYKCRTKQVHMITIDILKDATEDEETTLA